MKKAFLIFSFGVLLFLTGCSTTKNLADIPTSTSTLGITGIVQVTNTNYGQIASLPEKLKDLYASFSSILYGANAASSSDVRPLSGANVTLYTINNLSNPLATTVTNADGRYSFPEQNNNRVYVVKAEKTNNGKTITEHNVVHGSGVKETPIDPETSVAVQNMLDKYEVVELLKNYTPSQETSIGKVIQDIKQIVNDYYAVPSNPYPDCTTPITVPSSVSTNVSNLQYTLTVTNTTGGSVVQSPLPTAGKYQLGTVVTLTATPITGYVFLKWEGSVTATADVTTLNVSSDKSVHAVFVKRDVYVGGWYMSGSNRIPCYWKNGVKYDIDTNHSYVYINSLQVVGTDVYIAGGIHDGTKFIACYWKNGVRTDLSTNSSQGYSITVKNGDVYVAGIHNGKACYWKNGVLTEVDTVTSQGMSIAIDSNNNIFIVGDYGGIPCYWRNGTRFNLSVPSTGYAHHIKILNDNIYIVGRYDNSISCIWVNGIRTDISASSSEGRSIYFANNKIYATGEDNLSGWNRAYLWIDGIKTFLSNVDSVGDSIFVFNNDVYVAGSETDGTKQKAVFWKNGVRTDLYSSTASEAWAIYVTGE